LRDPMEKTERRKRAPQSNQIILLGSKIGVQKNSLRKTEALQREGFVGGKKREKTKKNSKRENPTERASRWVEGKKKQSAPVNIEKQNWQSVLFKKTVKKGEGEREGWLTMNVPKNCEKKDANGVTLTGTLTAGA